LVGRSWLDFPTTLAVFPSGPSHLTVPSVDLSHSLAFDSLTPCEVGDVLWSTRYPCCVQATTEPPGCLPPTPGSCNSSRYFVTEVAFGRSSPAEFSDGFHHHSTQSASPLRASEPFVPGLTTLFSITFCRCRPTASSVWMLPLLLEAEQDSPAIARFLLWRPLAARYRRKSESFA